jgi:hypothetical protein
MSQPSRRFLTLAAVFLAGAVSASLVSSVTARQADEPDIGMPDGIPMDPEAMARWVRIMTPGEQHAELAATAGQWDITSRYWMAPDGEPQTSQMRSTITSELGGRFILERVTGEVMGMPFEGLGLMGYDIQKGKWISIWTDNMNTAVTISEGEAIDDDTIELFGEMYDPMEDKSAPFKIVLKEAGPDEQSMTMHSKVGGEWVRNMELQYTRSRRGAQPRQR